MLGHAELFLMLAKKAEPRSHPSAYVEVIADKQPVLREG